MTDRRFPSACAGVLLTLWTATCAALLYAPTEAQMGAVQRLFYFHVPAAVAACLGFFLAFVGSVQYLRTRETRWDRLAVGGAELGVVFAAIVLVPGPLWARPVWGVFWRWEPRLTSMLVLFAMYVAYLMVRRYGTTAGRTPRLAAVVGIVAFANVPLVYYSVRLWAADQQLHPRQVILAPEMKLALYVCLAAVGLLFFAILRFRLRLESLEARVQTMQELTLNLDE
ncbi:MAG: cytochrome c biogenesis protein [Candidatus Latescibacterota bacterium]